MRIRTGYHVAEADGAQAHEAEIARVYRCERSALLTLPRHNATYYTALYLCIFYVSIYITLQSRHRIYANRNVGKIRSH